MTARAALAIVVAVAGGMASMFSPDAAFAQGTQAAAAGNGGEILAAKCFQCHTDSMWRDQRQGRRAWEATLYRMVGRGATWEPEDITAMADYLGSDFGPTVPRVAPAAAKP